MNITLFKVQDDLSTNLIIALDMRASWFSRTSSLSFISFMLLALDPTANMVLTSAIFLASGRSLLSRPRVSSKLFKLVKSSLLFRVSLMLVNPVLTVDSKVSKEVNLREKKVI